MQCALFSQFAYNGSLYHSWQRQPNADSVQQTLEEALSTLLRTSIAITGAGRTDTGVHAELVVAHFDAHLSQELENNLVHLLNRFLDENIVVYSFNGFVQMHMHVLMQLHVPINIIWGLK